MTTTLDALDDGAAPPPLGDLGRGPAETNESALFRYDSDYWTIAFGSDVVRLRDTHGLHYLAHLLRHPGRDVDVVELVAGVPSDAESDAVTRERARQAVTKGIKRVLDRITAVHPTLGRHLRATTRCGYLCTYRPDPHAPIEWTA